MPSPLLSAEGLTVYYHTRAGDVRAVEDMSFSLQNSEILGLVGESGSGKSTLGLSLIRLVPPPGRIVSGNILLKSKNIMDYNERELQDLRGRQIAFVFQDPMMSLNPVKKIGDHFSALTIIHIS
jgi:peptide/nickel transport system ATP-binding protein